jgi:ABC-2 type transport system ATP-binding protein
MFNVGIWESRHRVDSSELSEWTASKLVSPIVSIENLTKSFSLGKYLRRLVKHGARSNGQPDVLRGINLEIREGEVLGLLGPNGAGKTTLVEILATVLLPTNGRASVCGHDVVQDAAAVRKLVSYCASASENFYPRLTASANLEFFAILNDLPPREARERIQSTLQQMGLGDKANVPFQHYSDGMKQRLAFARALLKEPRLVLLDEPTRSLDPISQGEIRKLIRGLLIDRLGKTVLLVTHSLAEVEQVCDRLAIMHRGQIVAIGTVDEVKKTRGGTDLASAFENAIGAAECQ